MRYETVHIVVDGNTISAGDLRAIIHPIWWTANIYDGPNEYERSLEKLSRSQRLVFAVKWYVQEVNNGGHLQFYSNSTGIVWRDAVEGLKALEAPELAEILEQSAQRLGGCPSLDRHVRNEQLKANRPDFKDLDKLFYAGKKKFDLDERIISFIRTRPSDFYFDGDIKRTILPPRYGSKAP